MGHGDLINADSSIRQTNGIQERERQIAVLREQNRKRKEPLPSAATLREALNQSDIISSKNLKLLAETPYSAPVISLYLHLTAQKLVPKEKGLVRFFRSLKQSETEKHSQFLNDLPRIQRRSLDHDLEEIETFLAGFSVPSGIRSAIVFKSGNVLNWATTLLVRTTDTLVIDSDPYIAPLEAILEENERVLALEVSKGRSDFFIYHLGYFRNIDTIKSFVPKDSVDATIPGRVQRHRLTHLQWHLKLTAHQCLRHFNEWSCNALVLMGENRVSHLLEEFLHDSLKQRIIQRIQGSPASLPDDRRVLIADALRAHKAQREVQAIQQLSDSNPEFVASGLKNVIQSCNSFLLKRLFISDRLEQSGFVCREHHYISLNDTECPFCSRKLMPVENIIDEIIEIARMHGVSLTMVEYRQELMSKYDGIAGLTYVPLSQR